MMPTLPSSCKHPYPDGDRGNTSKEEPPLSDEVAEKNKPKMKNSNESQPLNRSSDEEIHSILHPEISENEYSKHVVKKEHNRSAIKMQRGVYEESKVLQIDTSASLTDVTHYLCIPVESNGQQVPSEAFITPISSTQRAQFASRGTGRNSPLAAIQSKKVTLAQSDLMPSSSLSRSSLERPTGPTLSNSASYARLDSTSFSSCALPSLEHFSNPFQDTPFLMDPAHICQISDFEKQTPSLLRHFMGSTRSNRVTWGRLDPTTSSAPTVSSFRQSRDFLQETPIAKKPIHFSQMPDFEVQCPTRLRPLIRSVKSDLDTTATELEASAVVLSSRVREISTSATPIQIPHVFDKEKRGPSRLEYPFDSLTLDYDISDLNSKANTAVPNLRMTKTSNSFDGRSTLGMKKTFPSIREVAQNQKEGALNQGRRFLPLTTPIVSGDVLNGDKVSTGTPDEQPSIFLPRNGAPIAFFGDCVEHLSPSVQQNMKWMRWTEAEDAILHSAVEKEGTNWKRISRLYFLSMRTMEQCKNRYTKSLQPGLIKGFWTSPEDETILRGVTEGLNWPQLAETLPGRTAENIRNRWLDAVDPSIKKSPWNEEETKILFRGQARFGNRWQTIAMLLPGRSVNNVKNRWYNYKMAQKRKIKKMAKATT